MTTHTDILIGRIALERGLVTTEQLADCLKEQTRRPAGQVPPLGEILLERGFIRRPDLDSLLEEQKRRLAEALEINDTKLEDTLLGRLLVRSGLATEKQVYECLRVQAELSEQGKPAPRLGELLVRKGFLTTDAISTALILFNQGALICPHCGARYTASSYDPQMQYRCKKCNGLLRREEHPPEEHALPTSGSPLPDDVTAALGDPANMAAGGKYVLIREVGRGGMGVVWKAWQVDLERYVAIKHMSDGLWGESELKRFFREAHTAANLSHPNIATIYEVGSHDGKHFIAMEYVDGEPLANYHFGTPHTARYAAGGRAPRHMGLQQAVRTVRDAALAVEYAHSRGVIHRDIKPHNVMVSRHGNRAYVMDFGIAKPVRNQDGISLGDTIVGTPSYMSPEQARGESLNKLTDVYSLGACLYYVLTGRPPIGGHSAAEILLKVLTDDPLPPRALNPAVPADLEHVALKALQKDRHERYASAKALADDLTRYLEGQPVQARAQSMGMRTVRAIRKRPTMSVAIAMGVTALLLVVLAFQWAMSRDQNLAQDSIARAEAFAAAGDFKAALFYFKVALDIDPGNRAAQLGKKRCEQEILAGRSNIPEWRQMADMHYDRGEYGSALRLYERLSGVSADETVLARRRECELMVARENEANQDLKKVANEHQALLEREKLRRDQRTRAMPHYASAQQLIDAAERLKFRIDADGDVTLKYHEALLSLDKCLTEDPSYIEALYLRAQIRARLGEFDHAADEYSAILEREADFPPAAFGLAMANLVRATYLAHAPYVSLEERYRATSEALARTADHAGRVANDAFERWAARSIAHLCAQRHAEASEALGRISAEGRAQRSYYFISAVLRVEEKNPRDAIQELTTLLEYDPMAAEALFLRSILLGRLGHRSQALADASRVVALLPDHALSYLTRASAHEAQGQKEKAAQDLEKAADLDPALAPMLAPAIERLRHP